jgi:uncharacterized protein Yka (UPF0111/DUF47 family)
MKHWFLPETPDVLAVLREQAAQTVEGVRAFAEWSAGDASQERAVRVAEHAADETRRRLLVQLRAAFSTPMDAEDIYELSERLDAVLNGAKNAVREADLMGLHPNAALADMARAVLEGVSCLSDSFAALPNDADAATKAADAAIKCQRLLERRYRVAMSELLAVTELRDVVTWREIYRRYARLGDAIVRVAERVWYATVKEG